MLVVTETASAELKKALAGEQAKDKYLVLNFMGAGWSGPTLGMTLYESTDGLEKLESNGITAYIDPKLLEYLKNVGEINVDFISTPDGRNGFAVQVGEKSCGDCQCPSDQEGEQN